MRRVSDADLNSNEDELVNHRLFDCCDVHERHLPSSPDDIRAVHRHGARRETFSRVNLDEENMSLSLEKF